MGLNAVRHESALETATQKIFQSNLAGYAKELYLYGSVARGEARWDSDIDLLLVLEPMDSERKKLRKEIVYLKGSIADDDLDAPDIDLKIVFGDAWKKSNQTFYKNILEEGQRIWKKI